MPSNHLNPVSHKDPGFVQHINKPIDSKVPASSIASRAKEQQDQKVKKEKDKNNGSRAGGLF